MSMPSQSDPTEPKPPPYSNAQGDSITPQLKQSFMELADNQVQIQDLFKSVSAKLETSKQIGENHPLYNEWNELRQTHRKLYRDSQQNAGLCSTFLNNYATILVPLSQMDISVAQKKFAIGKFVEVIPVHSQTARDISDRFHELYMKVEVFPLKVASALRTRAEPSGIFESIWTGLEEVCMSVWQTLRKLFVQIVTSFENMLQRLETIRFSCAGLLSVDFSFTGPYCRMHPEIHEMSSRATTAAIKEECKDLSERLSGFEDAWHLVRLSCNALLSNLAMAKSLASVPAACDAHLRSAEAVYLPLVECLRAYARGQLPIF